jgi:hypothetical protein
MTMGGKNELVSDAKLLKLDIYPDTVMCVDGDVPPGSTPLLASQTFVPGEAITLNIPPGRRTLVLTTYADEAGTILTGSGCTTTTLAPGGQVCINLTILAAPDLAVVADLSVRDMRSVSDMPPVSDMADLSVNEAGCVGNACPCIPAGSQGGDSCPGGEFCDSQSLHCAVGCKNNDDCVGMGPAGDGGLPRTSCNTTLHQCVECLGNADCPLGKLCSPSGVCVVGCNSGHACPGGLSCCNSMCVDLTSDPLNCGSCGNPCSVGNATTCCASQCTDLNTSADNCGMCGRACSSSNVATRHCAVGQCKPDCNTGRGDCNLPGTNDGCETDITTPAHCGGCNTACADNNTGHATSSACNFDGGTCTYACSSPFADCDTSGANSNGCETNIQNGDPVHCGGCMNSACDTVNSLSPNCASGACVYGGCATNQGDCTNSGDPRNLLGCETPTTSVAHCGNCTACDPSNASTRTCALDAGTHCVYGCNSPFADCDKTPPDNTQGCTTNTSNDILNCTNCGLACDTANSNGASCNGSKCSYTSCKSARVNCDSSGVDTNGCECPTATVSAQGTVNGCCGGTGCQTQHDNGLGGHYYDCVGSGTYSQTQATAACTSNNNGTCRAFFCVDGTGKAYNDDVICDHNGTGTCNCWAFPHTPPYPSPTPSPGTGHVNVGTCLCPGATDPVWN